MIEQRLTLFVDAQNVYKGAREAFGSDSEHYTFGQVNPLALGTLICERGPAGFKRTLEQVRIYTGRPEAGKQPKTYGAHMAQCAVWEKAGALVIPRTLRYPIDWPQEKPQEKGIDVALAVDFVMAAIDGKYDVGVIASVDSDLRPALEYVCQKFNGVPRCEVAAWRSNKYKRRLSVVGLNIWCHYLAYDDFKDVHDPTSYA